MHLNSCLELCRSWRSL